MAKILICSICRQKVAGSPLINPADILVVGTLLSIHLIDEHWDIVEKIRSTTGNPDARMDIFNDMAGVLFP